MLWRWSFCLHILIRSGSKNYKKHRCYVNVHDIQWNQHRRSLHANAYFTRTVVFATLKSSFLKGAQHKHDYLEGDAVVSKYIKLKLTDMLGHFDVAAAFRAWIRSGPIICLMRRRASTARLNSARSRGTYKRSWRAELWVVEERGEWDNLAEDFICSVVGDNLTQVQQQSSKCHHHKSFSFFWNTKLSNFCCAK